MKRRSCILSLLLLCFATAFAKADTHVVTNIPIPRSLPSHFGGLRRGKRRRDV